MAIPSLLGSYIDATYQRLVQVSGSEFADGLGNPITFGTGISGNGINGYIPLWSGSTALTSSFLSQSSGVLKTIYNGSDIGLKLDFTNGQYTFGDNIDPNYVSKLVVNGGAASGDASILLVVNDNHISNSELALDINSTNKWVKTYYQGNDIGLNLDFNNNVLLLGKGSSLGDGYIKGVAVLPGTTALSPIIYIGDRDFDNPGNKTFLEINDPTQIIKTSNQNFDIGLKLDFVSGSYYLGDYDNNVSGSRIVVNDIARTITVSGSQDVELHINAAPVSPAINLFNFQNFT